MGMERANDAFDELVEGMASRAFRRERLRIESSSGSRIEERVYGGERGSSCLGKVY